MHKNRLKASSLRVLDGGARGAEGARGGSEGGELARAGERGVGRRAKSASRSADSSTATARSVVPSGLVTRRRSSAGSSPERHEQLRRAEEGPLDQLRACSRREALADRRLGELLDQEEHVGGAGAGDRAQRIQLRLGHLDDLADRLEERRARAPGRPRRARVPALTPGDRLADDRRACSASTGRPHVAGSSDSIVAMVTPAATLTTTASGLERDRRSRAAGRAPSRASRPTSTISAPSHGGAVRIRRRDSVAIAP